MNGPALRGGIAWGFERGSVSVSIDALLAMKPLRPDIKMSAKYRQIVTSIKAVGLVEPPVVIPASDQPGVYYVLDGHLRLEVLRDLGVATVDCLISRDDEAFTYNKRVNRLSAPQEHRMIARAIERGVSEVRLAEALGINVTGIQRRARLMDGIAEDVVELLKDSPCSLAVFDVLRKMGPMRQREAAELMVGHSNFGRPFVMAILAATPDMQLASGRGRRKQTTSTVTREQVARLERELATLQVQIKAVEETYGLDNLHLTVARAYLVKLLGNARVVRWLAQQKPEYLTEFQNIAELTTLPTDDVAAAAE
ncbi:MAG: RepB plasmid partition [Frondihabitans sp.]|nr:RepB plasmid partition [Frondihabitans sp.]